MKDTKELVEYLIHKSEVKINREFIKIALLGFMAGALIALGSVGNIVASANLYKVDPGFAKFIGASVFPVGLIVIVLLGYDLYTSSCMGIVSVFDKKEKLSKYIVNILVVLFFNFIGCLFIAYITVRTHTLSEEGKQLLFNMAAHKVHASAYEIFLKGILCNVLVCAATIISYGTKDSIGKIFGVWFPIMLFIILGYDHIVANMLYLPAAYMLNSGISILEILHNFLFAGIGNLVGGAFFIVLPLYIAAKNLGENNAKN
ncbi:formate/nitrite transporter family protein [Oceanivirga miroungae]|uniref:Formate/nitrite transporter n=1 Tax=Oceanivirga miroungae TaxID=1130046 RepID=A0A6I8MFD5_9FUSO|nr:formate/nitrite transporter family protein [Oceanivirga miroungae]VWL85808.1 formate/nitrite transporter [Oceanivirga miroungae]